MLPQQTPVVPTTSLEGELSQEQMKSNLQDMMSKIDSKYQDFNSQKFASDNKFKEQQSEALRQLFDLFQSVGIDPSDVEKVGAYLKKLKESNPELSQQLETALNTLLGEDVPTPNLDTGGSESGVSSPQVGISSPDNMNINNNDQQTPQNL